MQSGHALVGALMPEYDPVTKISIVPRGQAGGLTFFAPSEERLESGLYRRVLKDACSCKVWKCFTMVVAADLGGACSAGCINS